jgi:hypothetical protein
MIFQPQKDYWLANIQINILLNSWHEKIKKLEPMLCEYQNGIKTPLTIKVFLLLHDHHYLQIENLV